MRKGHMTVQEVEELMLRYSSEIRKLSYQIEQSQKALDDLKNQLEEAPKQAAAPKTTAMEQQEPAAKKEPAATKKEPAAKKAKASKATAKKTAAPKATETAAEAPKRGRGRPPKAGSKPAAPKAAADAPKRGPGRPPKNAGASPAPVKEKKAKKPAAPKVRTLAQEESKPKGYRLSEWDLFIVNTLKASKKAMVKADFSKKAMEKIKKEKLSLGEQELQGKLTRSIHKLSRKRGELIKTDYPGKGSAYGLAEWADAKGDIREEFTAHLNAK